MKNKINQKDFVNNFISERVKQYQSKNNTYVVTAEGLKLLNQHALAMYQLYIRS